MKMVLKIMENNISLTEDIPIIIVTYLTLFLMLKDTTVTKMYGHHAYKNKYKEK